MMTATGLSKRTLEYGRESLKKFDEETVKAKIESETIIANSAVNIVLNEDQASSKDNEIIRNQNNIDSDCETVYSEESVSVDDNSGKMKRLSLSLSDHLILSRYVCSNIVANIVSNIYMYVMRHVRT